MWRASLFTGCVACPCISPFIHLCFHMSLSLSVFPCIHQSGHPSVCLPKHPYVCSSACPSSHLSVCPPICLSTHLSMCLHPSICLPICLSIDPSVHPVIYLSICLPVAFLSCLPASLSIHTPQSTRTIQYLYNKVPQLQFTEYLSHNPHTLSIRNHGVILTSNIEILVGKV